MKAWKRIHITKKRAACGVLGLLLLAAAYMGVPRAAEKVFAVAEGERRLPIYCVQTEKPQVSVSFDAAWGADDTDELLRILKENGVKATFFVPGLTAERYPEVIKRIAEQGHEIGHHGYAHERFAGKTTEEQIEIIEKTQKIFKDLIGHEVTGFRTPSGDWAKNTPKLLYERGFRYSSSMRGDDRPYRTVIDGEETDFIEIPTKWEVDDYVAMAYHMYPAEPAGQDRISSYRLVEDNFMREFKGHYREGLCISYMNHPQVIGCPGKIQILDHLLKYITSKEDVWVATGTEIADWYRKQSEKQIGGYNEFRKNEVAGWKEMCSYAYH